MNTITPTYTERLTDTLLDFYQSTDIMDIFNGSSDGIPMLYVDDAIISSSRLVLTSTGL